MNKPYEIGDLSEDEYHILMMSIELQYLRDALAKVTDNNAGYYAALYGNFAIEIINGRTIEHNRRCVDGLKEVFCEKVMKEFSDE